MALKTVHLTRLPNFNHTNNVPPSAFNNYHHHDDDGDTMVQVQVPVPANEFMVIGHRGTGMNLLQSSDPKKKLIKENSILAFNFAGEFDLDFIEFDVQVIKDDCPIVFHDNFIFTEEKGEIIEKRVTDMNLGEFLSYGPQRDSNKVVYKYAKDRSIFFSSFQPDATLLVRKLQNTYPVFFLTNGGLETYTDVRRNSLEEAMKMCLAGFLNGIVSEVRSVIRNPGVIKRIKDSKLSLISFGQLNNVREVVNAQILMGVDGVIVDFVHEITEAVADYDKTVKPENVIKDEDDDDNKCSQNQLSNLMKLIPDYRV